MTKVPAFHKVLAIVPNFLTAATHAFNAILAIIWIPIFVKPKACLTVRNTQRELTIAYNVLLGSTSLTELACPKAFQTALTTTATQILVPRAL